MTLFCASLMTLEQLPMSHYVKLSPCLVLKQSLAHFYARLLNDVRMLLLGF